MRLLANENFPYDAVAALRESGHDVLWIRTEAPGSSDSAILARAQAEERILITLDKDFGELAFRSGLPASCGIILFRIPAPSSSYVARAEPALKVWPGRVGVGASRLPPMRLWPRSATASPVTAPFRTN